MFKEVVFAVLVLAVGNTDVTHAIRLGRTHRLTAHRQLLQEPKKPTNDGSLQYEIYWDFFRSVMRIAGNHAAVSDEMQEHLLKLMLEDDMTTGRPSKFQEDERPHPCGIQETVSSHKKYVDECVREPDNGIYSSTMEFAPPRRYMTPDSVVRTVSYDIGITGGEVTGTVDVEVIGSRAAGELGLQATIDLDTFDKLINVDSKSLTAENYPQFFFDV